MEVTSFERIFGSFTLGSGSRRLVRSFPVDPCQDFLNSCGLSVNRVILSDWTGPGSTKDSWDPLRDFWGSFQYFSKVCTICWIFKIPKDFFRAKYRRCLLGDPLLLQDLFRDSWGHFVFFCDVFEDFFIFVFVCFFLEHFYGFFCAISDASQSFWDF